MRQHDLCDVRQTRVMRGSSSCSDHRLVRCITALVIKPKQHRQRLMPTKKLCVKQLFIKDIRCQFQDRIEYSLADMTESSDIDCFWIDMKTKTFQCASDGLGHTKCKHQDWFDMNEPAIQPLFDSMREAHLGWIRDKSLTAKKIAYTSLRQSMQAKLRSLKENWWMKKAEDLQAAADEHDMKRLYPGLKSVLGSQSRSTTPIFSHDGSTLLTKHEVILQYWADHFNLVLNRSSVVDDTVLDDIPQLECESFSDVSSCR